MPAKGNGAFTIAAVFRHLFINYSDQYIKSTFLFIYIDLNIPFPGFITFPDITKAKYIRNI